MYQLVDNADAILEKCYHAVRVKHYNMAIQAMEKYVSISKKRSERKKVKAARGD